MSVTASSIVSADTSPAPPASARDRLLDATARLITARETLEISLAEIAAQSGVNAALVKYYFGSKAGLLLALLRRDSARALREMPVLLAMALPEATRMRLHLRGMLRAYRRAPYLNRLLLSLLGGSDAALAGEIHDFLVRPVMACQRCILQAGEATGVFRAVDPMLFYLGAIGACDQFLHAERVYRLSTGQAPDAGFADRHMKFAEDMIMAGLRPVQNYDVGETP